MKQLTWGCSLLVLVVAVFAVVGCNARCSGVPGYRTGLTNVTIDTPADGERHFLIYVPASYNQSRKTPLQLLFHGVWWNCSSWWAYSGFDRVAEMRGYIIVTPCAMQASRLLGHTWNAGRCCGWKSEDKPNDFQFARSIVEIVSSEMCIDSNRIAATGSSNGGMMAESLACEQPDIWSAVASALGIVQLRPGNAAGIERCTKSISSAGLNRPRVLMIHGDNDPIVPWTGNALLGFPSVPDNVKGWVERNACRDGPHVTLNVSNFTNQVWGDCAGWNGGAGSVEIVRQHHGGHRYPHGNKVFDATEYIANFLGY